MGTIVTVMHTADDTFITIRLKANTEGFRPGDNVQVERDYSPEVDGD